MLRHFSRVRLRSPQFNAVRRLSALPLNNELDPGHPAVILPDESEPRGVGRIKRKRVSKNIQQPHYVTGSEITRPPGQASIIPLGDEDEVGIRAACKLARETLKLAGSIAKVHVSFMLKNPCPYSFPARCNDGINR
jgi:hypothetical protein